VSDRNAMDNRGAERWVWLGFVLVVIAVVAAGLWSLHRRDAAAAAPPVIGAVPDFQLVERSGAPLSRADLAGTPWVADFIFTRCSGTCPTLSTRMAALQRALRQRGLAARLVSFSVDPTHDTPEVLRDYGRRFAADETQWLFVTGEREALHRLIGEGFRLSVAERSPEQAGDGGELITHSDRFVLVDRQLRIRGYYHGSDADDVARLRRDAAALRAERSS